MADWLARICHGQGIYDKSHNFSHAINLVFVNYRLFWKWRTNCLPPRWSATSQLVQPNFGAERFSSSFLITKNSKRIRRIATRWVFLIRLSTHAEALEKDRSRPKLLSVSLKFTFFFLHICPLRLSTFQFSLGLIPALPVSTRIRNIFEVSCNSAFFTTTFIPFNLDRFFLGSWGNNLLHLDTFFLRKPQRSNDSERNCESPSFQTTNGCFLVEPEGKWQVLSLVKWT